MVIMIIIIINNIILIIISIIIMLQLSTTYQNPEIITVFSAHLLFEFNITHACLFASFANVFCPSPNSQSTICPNCAISATLLASVCGYQLLHTQHHGSHTDLQILGRIIKAWLAPLQK